MTKKQQIRHEAIQKVCHLHTVNDQISARGAYLKIGFLRGRLFEPAC